MCRVNVGHPWVTAGHCRSVTRGNHRVNIGQIRVTPGHLMVNLGLVKVTLWSL